jgi:hypothetical protein
MPLNKQVIPVAFSGSLDTKTSEKLVVPGMFLALSNWVRRKAGQLDKRFGFSALGKNVIGGSTVDAGRRLHRFGNELLLFNDENVYSYIESSNVWSDRGDSSSLSLTTHAVVATPAIHAMPDVAYGAGYLCVAWEDSAGGSRVSLLELSSNLTVIDQFVLSATASRPQITFLQNRFLVTYIDSSELRLRTIDTASPTTVSAFSTLLATVADLPYAVRTYDNSAAVFLVNRTAPTLTAGYLIYNGLVGTGANGYPTTQNIGAAAANTVDICVDADHTVPLIYLIYETGADVKVDTRTTTLAGSLDTDTLFASTAVRNLTSALDPATSTVWAFAELEAADPENHTISTSTVKYSGGSNTVTAISASRRGTGLVAGAFAYSGSVMYHGGYESDLQSTNFVFRSDARILGKSFAGASGGLTRDATNVLKTGLPKTVAVSDTRFISAYRVKSALKADNDGTVYSDHISLYIADIEFGRQNYEGATIGSNFHIAGGVLNAYDGVSVTESGFHIYPEIVSATVGAGGSLDTAADPGYSVAFVYEWVDARGQIHRSAPSILDIEATASGDKIDYEVRTLRHTEKTAPRADCKIVLYRTIADGQILYRETSVTNDPTVDTLTITATISDTDISVNEILYTTGGVLENIAPPSSLTTIAHKNRLWLAGLEDPNEIAFSKFHTSGEGLAFSDFFRKKVSPEGGGVSALGTLDDKVIFFKRDRIFWLNGDGPTDTGIQDDYGEPQRAQADVGCATPASVVETPAGVMFKSDKGIYILDRALTTRYIGAPVEAYNDLTITSGVVLEDVNEVRFTTSTGVCLVYNYYFDQWSTFDNYVAASAVLGPSAYLHLKADGTVNQEAAATSLTPYLDNGARIRASFETSWMSFAGLQGFQRIYRILGLGNFVAHHYSKMDVAFDYENSYNDSCTFDTRIGLGTSTYGTGDYGEETPYGGSGSSVYQWRWKPKRQKCEAVKIRFQDIDTISTSGSGTVSFVALSFEVGVKGTSNKMGAHKTIGS